MVRAEQKKQMSGFITGLLEESGLYNILEQNDSNILVVERPDLVDNPKTIDVLAHNYRRTKDELRGVVISNNSEGISTAHIFYKDDETFMVRLGGKGNIKDERSLKDYSKQQIDSMTHLRDIEKIILGLSGGDLSYYQPETERLEESTRTFQMRNVRLDYSHIGRENPGYGFVHNKVSDDYKLPVEIASTNVAIRLVPGANNYARIEPIEPIKQVKLEQISLF